VGRLEEFFVPDGLRVETGVEQGSEISPFYDPMIAKLVAVASDRATAIELLTQKLRLVGVWPVRTNAGFLWQLLEESAVRAGSLDTGYIGENAERLATPLPVSGEHLVEVAQHLAAVPGSGPWARATGFRINASACPVIRLRDDELTLYEVPVMAVEDGEPAHFVNVFANAFPHQFRRDEPRGSGHLHAHDGDILSPMPGKIIAVEVVQGQAVTKGQKLLTLEAMKMEHTLTAPFDGVVAELAAVAGAQVQVEAVLARIEAKPD
jgi:3-methylcrotonyl-CoA carboxylase alpha subunit